MMISALLGVQDEVELIGLCIDHLRDIGVDWIDVIDTGSTDGTLDIVTAQARLGDVGLTRIRPHEIRDYTDQSRHDLALARVTNADWVLVLDADEFWLPATGSLKTSRLAADVVIARRYNVALAETGPLLPRRLSPLEYEDVRLLAREVPCYKSYIESPDHHAFITVMPGDKPLARLSCMTGIMPGGHDVDATFGSRRVVATDMVVAHVAFSSLSRFKRKVRNIRAEMRRRPALFAGDFAWHWRRWAEMTDEQLEVEFALQVATDDQLVTWAEQGVLRNAAALLERGRTWWPQMILDWWTSSQRVRDEEALS